MRQIIGLSYLMAIVLTIVAVSVLIVTCNIGSDDTHIQSKNGIHFIDGSFSKLTALSKKEHKPIFLLAYANYCSVCKKMKREVLSQEEIGSFFNAKFINFAVDIESSYGNEIVNKYQIGVTPTILFLDSNGEVLKKAEGFQDKEDLFLLSRSNIILSGTSNRK